MKKFTRLEDAKPDSVKSFSLETRFLKPNSPHQIFAELFPGTHFNLMITDQTSVAPVLLTTTDNLVQANTNTRASTLGVAIDSQGNIFQFDEISADSLAGLFDAFRTMRLESISAAFYNFGPNFKNTRHVEYQGNILLPDDDTQTPQKYVASPRGTPTKEKVLQMLAFNDE